MDVIENCCSVREARQFRTRDDDGYGALCATGPSVGNGHIWSTNPKTGRESGRLTQGRELKQQTCKIAPEEDVDAIQITAGGKMNIFPPGHFNVKPSSPPPTRCACQSYRFPICREHLHRFEIRLPRPHNSQYQCAKWPTSQCISLLDLSHGGHVVLLYTKIECQSSTLPRSNARPTPNGYFHALRLVVLQRIDPASKTTVAKARCTFPTFPCTGAPHATRAAPAQSATVFNPHRLPPLPSRCFSSRAFSRTTPLRPHLFPAASRPVPEHSAPDCLETFPPE